MYTRTLIADESQAGILSRMDFGRGFRAIGLYAGTPWGPMSAAETDEPAHVAQAIVSIDSGC
jgi:hypothetical protein